MSKTSHKVEEGKLLQLKLDIQDEKVEGVRLTGDFFLEPPEKLGEIEEKLEEFETSSSIDKVVKELQSVDAEFIGFSAEDLGEAFRKAVEGDEE